MFVLVGTREVHAGLAGDKPSQEMLDLNKAFKRAHAMSIHLNLIAVMAILFYGFRLAMRIKVE